MVNYVAINTVYKSKKKLGVGEASPENDGKQKCKTWHQIP